MHEIVRSRFSPPLTGTSTPPRRPTEDNSHSDGDAVSRLLTEMILPVSQFFAYLEVGEDRWAAGSICRISSPLDAVSAFCAPMGAPLSMRKVSDPQPNLSGCFTTSFSGRRKQGESRAMTADSRIPV